QNRRGMRKCRPAVAFETHRGTTTRGWLGVTKEQVRAALADYGEQPRIDIGSLTFAENQVLGGWFPEESS
ncbi:MAG: hypothetical protein ACJ8AI_22385, partial [Rhodopila sp.]